MRLYVFDNDDWDNWSESTLTFNNKPNTSYNTPVALTTIQVGLNQWSFTLSTTSYSNDELSLFLKLNSESVDHWAGFYSEEWGVSSERPYLEVTTAAIPVPGSLLLLASGLIGLGAEGWRRRRG